MWNTVSNKDIKDMYPCKPRDLRDKANFIIRYMYEYLTEMTEEEAKYLKVARIEVLNVDHFYSGYALRLSFGDLNHLVHIEPINHNRIKNSDSIEFYLTDAKFVAGGRMSHCSYRAFQIVDVKRLTFETMRDLSELFYDNLMLEYESKEKKREIWNRMDDRNNIKR